MSESWFPKNETPLSNEALKARKAYIAKAKAEAKAELEAGTAKAASEARTLWEHATPADENHPYLKTKHVGAYGIRKLEGALVVPLYDVEGKLWSLQFIQVSGKKYFLTHGRVYGCFYIIGKVESNTPKVYIAEGYATAESIHMATGCPCVVSFNAGNLEPVIAALRQKYPNISIIVAADNDQWKERNTGKEKAEEAAAMHGCSVVLPEFSDTASKPTDFNDLHVLEGLEVVKHQLSKVLPTTPKPIIVIQGGGLSDEATEGEQALITAGIQIYQRGNNLVRPITTEVDAAKGKRTTVAQLIPVEHDYLLDKLCGVAEWKKFSRKSETYMRVNPPFQVAKTILSRSGEWHFLKIAGVITTPTIRPDGSLLHVAGYDPITRLLLVDPPLMPVIPESPTKEDAITALALLQGLIAEFPFRDEESCSVALSALITPVIRGAFAVAPMHAIRAHTAGSGKSFLLDVAAAIATGHRCPVMAAGKTEEETEKRLGAALLAGQPIISIDNVNGELGGDFLCQAIERPVVDIRILGKSEQARIESRSTVFATGNNLCLVEDMTRRVVLCTLDSNQERPELRQFTHNPFAMVMADRGKYIAAILTIIRAYIVAGKPNPAPRLASFEEWSDLVRSALIWLGEADPVTTMETARQEDPTLQIMGVLFKAIHEAFGSDQHTAAEIIQYANCGGKLHDAIQEAVDVTTGSVSSRMLGKYLSRHKGRIINGLRLDAKADNHGHAKKWYVAQCG